MPGGLLQLVAVGAQNELVNGNPSMTHFRSVFRRHTNFAMESIRMTFGSSNLEFSATSTKTISCRIDRYANMLHDTYLLLTLPDIYSPLKYLGQSIVPPTGYDPTANALGYEFQWVKNIGYNLIDHITITANGQEIQRLGGEWLKMYSYLTHDKNKRQVVDEMIGNIPELYDPATAYDRMGQYPHSVAPVAAPGLGPNTLVPEPSIRSRQLIIPLHFWFCENPGQSLPLDAMQNSDIFINVTYRPMEQIYTVVDVNPTSATYGKRVRPTNYPLSLFLSPPKPDGTPSNPLLTTFFPDPFLEGNFIWLTDMEKAAIAIADQTFLVKTVKYVNNPGQFGGNSDIELPFFNLVTRIVFATQRSDKIAINDWDNYTNWDNPSRAPYTTTNADVLSPVTNSLVSQNFLYSSGQQQISSVYPRDPVVNGVLLLDGKERFSQKPTGYFSLIQMYRHATGDAPVLPGVYQYSFALNNDQYQPSGSLNGSMFNKVTLRLTLQQPLPLSAVPSGGSGGGTSAPTVSVCVLKSTVFNPNPTIITAAQQLLTKPDGSLLYPISDLVTIVRNVNGDNAIYSYTYNLGVYVESVNFLRIVSGLANFVFAN